MGVLPHIPLWWCAASGGYIPRGMSSRTCHRRYCANTHPHTVLHMEYPIVCILCTTVIHNTISCCTSYRGHPGGCMHHVPPGGTGGAVPSPGGVPSPEGTGDLHACIRHVTLLWRVSPACTGYPAICTSGGGRGPPTWWTPK